MKEYVLTLPILVFTLLVPVLVLGQSGFSFAQISDIHVGSSTGADDLRRAVTDINENDSIRFVILTGDITEFGADQEYVLAKRILDSLNKPLHVIPGNHDANWSESGGNTVITTFGAQTCTFTYGGYRFLGTACGPFMRMGPGQIPREDILWLKTQLAEMKDTSMPVIFLNHYPMDSSLNNWYEAIDLLKTRNIQLIICGHGHTDHRYTFEGIPGVMGRSTLRGAAPVGGYNIVTISGDTAYFRERIPGVATHAPWTTAALYNHHFAGEKQSYPRPDFGVNHDYPRIRTRWQYEDKSDIGAGVARSGNLLFSTDTWGDLYALRRRSGRVKWRFHTGGKIYATPAASRSAVVVTSSDHKIYCVEASTGRLRWSYTTAKPDVATPLIHGDTVFVGGSDGHFRALDLRTGKVLWDFDKVRGFMVSKPLRYGGKLYFGCWGNAFYCLEASTGKVVWTWNAGYTNRMYSPAVCQPAAVGGRIFIVAPDRAMTCLDASTGQEIWRKKWPGVRVRESMGLTRDSSLVLVKTMEGSVYGVSASADSMQLSWQAKVRLGYEICPTPIATSAGRIYVPTQSGLVVAVSRKTGTVLWKHKISNCLVNSILTQKHRRLIVSTMDGKITCLKTR
jgi:outer membrane protein assembly factor BamB